MANEIYHRSNWGESKPEGFGDMYFDSSATNKLYNRSTYYENSDATDKILGDIPNKVSIVLTPTGYSEDSINTAIPPYQVLPTNIVTNGTFNTDSDWTKETGWTISNGKANFNASLSTAGYIIQTNILELGKKYKLNATVDEGVVSLISAFYDVQQGENIQTGTSSIFTVTSGTDLRLYSHPSNGNASITDITVQEIQEADFTFARNSSATRVNQAGLIEASQSNDTPRLDYTTGQGAFLLERQSTNLITYSEDFSQWINDGNQTSASTITDTNPDGTSTVYQIDLNTGGNLYKTITVSSSTDYTLSIYIKGSGSGKLVLSNAQSSPENSLDFTATNEWQRIKLTGSSANTSIRVAIGSWSNSSANGTIQIYGAQLEQQSFVTSYIPTVGSTVTRSAESANSSGNSDLFNDSEGVLYAEISSLANYNTQRWLGISDGTTSNRVIIGLLNSATDFRFAVEITNAGSSQAFMTYNFGAITPKFTKVAVKYKNNDFALWVNGIERETDTSGNAPTGLNTLNFDRGDGGQDYEGKSKRIAVFKEALTDIELEKLTSWRDFRDLAESLEYTLVTIKSDAIVVSAYGTTSGGGGVSGGGSGEGGGY